MSRHLFQGTRVGSWLAGVLEGGRGCVWNFNWGYAETLQPLPLLINCKPASSASPRRLEAGIADAVFSQCHRIGLDRKIPGVFPPKITRCVALAPTHMC